MTERVSPPPEEWPPEFIRWMINRYIHRIFVAPRGNAKAGMVALACALMRGEWVPKDNTGTSRLIVFAASEQECINEALKQFHREQADREAKRK